MIEEIVLRNLDDYTLWLNDCRIWDRDFNPDINYRLPCKVYYCKTESNGYPVVYILEESIIT